MADPRRSLTPARSSPSGRHAWAGRRAAVRGALVLVWCAGGCAALGQLVADPKTENPVFVDESPAVVEGLTRAKEHLAGGNVDQAARTLMKVLDERPESLVASGADPMLFVPVRSRVHALLLSNRALLERFRELAGPSAKQMLEAGDLAGVQRSRLLTPEGLWATTRLGRSRVLEGRFAGGTMLLLELAGHPDLALRGAEVKEAVALAGRYETRAPERAGLSALLAAAGGGAPGLPAPEGVATPSHAPTLGGGSNSAVLPDVVSQPTGTGEFADWSMPVQPLRWTGEEQSIDQLPRNTREMRCWPVLSERSVFLSNGVAVSGFDRVSLRRFWRVDAGALLRLGPGETDAGAPGLRRPAAAAWEEVVQPALAGGGSLVMAVVGRDSDTASGTEGVEHLLAVDAESGAVRYAVALAGLDEQVKDAFARGPLVSDGRVVVVSMLKRQNQRRLVASILVGVDSMTGERVWTRTVGSAGQLPFYRASALTDSTVASDGVVFRYDRLGVVGAYSIADGRPLWVRHLSVKVSFESPSPQEPWMVHEPLVTAAGLVALSPDRDEVIVLDPATGAVRARRAAEDLRGPEYLLATPGHLVAVGKSAVATVGLGEIERGVPKVSGRLGAGPAGIRGRVTAAGSTVVVPTQSGVTVLDPADPASPVRTVALDEPGTALALPEGLMVVEDARVHMYCTWGVAAAHLKEQIAASPADAGPGAELLRLAERSGKGEELLPAADLALAALRARAGAGGEGAGGSAAHRSLVVATLLRAAERSSGVRVGQAGATLDASGVDGALERAAAAAESASDRAAVVLALATVNESRSRWGEAAAAYQRVIEEDELAASPAPGDAGSSSAAGVALEGLTRVVRAGGRGAYAPYDALLNGGAAALGPGASAAQLEELAGRYPLARGAPALWLRAAQEHAKAAGPQGPRLAARALERGVQSAERAGDAEPVVTGELNGLLVKNLADRSLLAAAADALTRAKAKFPGVQLTVGGSPAAAADMQGTVLADLAASRRWPRVGAPRVGRAPQVIDGWVLMEPLMRPTTGGSGGPPFVVLHKGDERRAQVALFGLRAGQLVGDAAEDAPSALAELWFNQPGSDPWTLVRTDAHGALFFIGDANGGKLARVDAEAGKASWQTEPFGSLFPGDPPARFGNNAAEPGWGRLVRDRGGASPGEPRQSEIIIATDERTICMVERAGRCAGIDADTGQVLWTARLPLSRISDATVSAGQLIVAGEFAQPQADSKVDRLGLFDARTGTQSAVNPAPMAGVRYMRTTTRGDLVLGSGGTIAAVNAADLETGRAAWTLTGHPAANAWEAWLLDDRLFVLGEDRNLWEVSALSGQAPARAIDVQGRLDARTPVTVWQTGEGVAAFATGRGLALIDGKGALRAADAVNSPEGTVSPAVVEGGVLLLAPPPAARGAGGLGLGTDAGVWNLYRLEASGAQLLSTTPIVFSAPPVRMAAIDGRVVISTSAGTMVIDAPPGK